VYNSVLAACEAAQQVEPALDMLEEMRAAGVPRDQYTFSTLISACYQVGLLHGR
jgi:pentatricopeptide repeat protein